MVTGGEGGGPNGLVAGGDGDPATHVPGEPHRSFVHEIVAPYEDGV